jgi:transcriptional regulator with XRE-family HTH domain
VKFAAALARTGLAAGDIAALAGVRHETVSRARHGHAVRVSTIAKIAGALEVPVESLMLTARSKQKQLTVFGFKLNYLAHGDLLYDSQWRYVAAENEEQAMAKINDHIAELEKLGSARPDYVCDPVVICGNVIY